MAKPYLDGKFWAMRRRFDGHEVFVSGCATGAAAKKKMDAKVQVLTSGGRPQGLGPYHTTFAQALQDYAVERLPFQKGAVQEANRINKFLRAVDLSTIALSKCKGHAATAGSPAEQSPVDKKGKGKYFDVRLEPTAPKRKVANGLSDHRAGLAAATEKSDKLRARLAATVFAEVTKHQVQKLMDALCEDGREPATLQLERAVIRRLFNYAAGTWYWGAPAANPAVDLVLPSVDNGRERVMSRDEQERLDCAIQDCRNSLIGPTVTLLTETAMRSSEPLEVAVWRDVDWSAKILRLRDSKNLSREVPLSPKAIKALQQLLSLGGGEPDDPIVRISYESLKAAWGRACERAGVDGLHLHDLRHTAATRMALKTGNIFLVKALTGHKTLSQVARYVNVKAGDVVNVMHAEAVGTLPAAPLTFVERVGDRPLALATGSVEQIGFLPEWAQN